MDTNNIFHTPGVFYRPAGLKTMTALLGNTEARTIYKNFHLSNLNSSRVDPSHTQYQSYLQHSKFLPQGERNYWVHTINSTLLPKQTAAIEGALSKGFFNLFPLDLMSSNTSELKIPATNLGMFFEVFLPSIIFYVSFLISLFTVNFYNF